MLLGLANWTFFLPSEKRKKQNHCLKKYVEKDGCIKPFNESVFSSLSKYIGVVN